MSNTTDPGNITKPSKWLSKVEMRFRTLERTWLKEAKRTKRVYESDDLDADGCATEPFNILFSNVETQLPALYNSTPRPDVQRRFTGTDEPISAAASQLAERTLEYLADTNGEEYESFDEAMRSSVLNALVPGLGQAKICFSDKDGYKSVYFERVAYDRFVWAYARAWKHVPWVAYGHDMTRADMEAQFPDAKNTDWFKKIDWNSVEIDSEDAPTPGDGRKEPTVLVWEIWDSVSKTVYFVSSVCRDEFLAEDPYPFNLTSKFPSPEPLRFIKKVDDLTPVPPYRFYASQAKELQSLTRRFTRVVNAIRVRGIYNSNIAEFASLLGQDSDNALVPSQGAMAFQDKPLEQQIWMMPVGELIQVAQSLALARQQVLSTIYQITGISDILRGDTDAGETAAAQKIKSQWGTLRIKRMQRDVQVFCRDAFRIAFEYASELFDPMTFKAITQVTYPTQVAQQGAQALLTQAQQVQQFAASMQTPIPPEVQAQFAKAVPQAQELLKQPSIEAVCGMLKNRFQRQYRIDIETNSTVDLEATEDKAAISEFMNAFGQMLAGIIPMVENGSMPFDAAKEIMLETTRRFRFGRQVEDALAQMKPPAGGGAGAQAQQAQLKDAQNAAELERVRADGARVALEDQKKINDIATQLSEARIRLAEQSSQHAMAINGLKNDFAGKNLTKDLSAHKDSVMKDVRELLTNAKADARVRQAQASAKTKTSNASV